MQGPHSNFILKFPTGMFSLSFPCPIANFPCANFSNLNMTWQTNPASETLGKFVANIVISDQCLSLITGCVFVIFPVFPCAIETLSRYLPGLQDWSLIRPKLLLDQTCIDE